MTLRAFKGRCSRCGHDHAAGQLPDALSAMMAERDAALKKADDFHRWFDQKDDEARALEEERDALRRELEARKPLTITALFAEMARIQSAKSFDPYTLSFVEGARFAERHHGIPSAGTNAEDKA